jgi:RHS repeat-associated protein
MFVYDEMDRETAKSLPGGVVIATTYLPDGRRATVTEPRGITSFAYDSAGRPGTVTHPAGEVVRYTHDASGNLLSITVPAATVSYGYDALDRLTQVSAPEGQTLTSFDLVGNVLRRTAANGIVSDAVFDVRNRPTLVTHRTAGGSALQSYSISWSPANRRSRITELDGSVESYSYDSRGRLQAELRTGTNPYSIAHVYDEVGNRIRTARDGTSTQFTYDANDRMTADGTATLVWDANGNLVSRTQGSLVARYGFDPEDRLTSILDGGASHQFAYDGDGNRVRATTASGTTRFLVDDHNNTGLSQVLEERDGGGNLAARHTYGDSLLALVRGDASKVVLADPLGSVRALADVTGALTDRYQFDAYGNSIVVTGSTPNPYRYRGQRLEESGLYHLRARDYSPAQGRFLSRDPFAGRAAVPLSRHRYLYSNADPVNLVDPAGAEPNTLSLTVAQGISSAVDKALTLGYAVNKGCSAFSQLSFINNLVLWGTVSVSAATAFMGWGDLVGKTGITFFGVSPGAFGDDVKKAKFNVSYQSAADWTESWSAAISLKLANETGRSLTVGAKGLYGSASVNVWDKPITRCGLEIGKVALKAGAKAGASLHSGQITGLLSAEISFLDTFQFEYPIFELGGQVKNGKHSLVDKTFGRDATRHASRP